MGSSNRTLTLDDDVWREAKSIIKNEMNISMSRFVEIQLRSIVRARKGTVTEVVEGAVKDFVMADRSLSADEKKKVNGLFDKPGKRKVKKK